MQGNKAFLDGEYETAISLYENAINAGYQVAMDLQADREKEGTDILSDEGIPVGFLWLVEARRNEASAKLSMGDLEGALAAVEASCDISGNKSADSLEMLADICQKNKDNEGE
eukprot:CAMPEP_0176035850 /NCGR_PEP_ID=MMETSP0120_2-20121206/17746_1 /TAXON_ID=160619 /ORGANISM="Kryptoperidinium foliaceum, Strain CCMP 1326" /LENGTH=112 /DNA_ID=CAMNT_0017369225 /DNA_START=187 /DNA_END=522 /DNA_ORIENTATION=+